MLDLTGSFAPLITPFTDDGKSLSEVRIARIVRWLTERHIEGLVLNTDVGEFTSTSFSERKAVMEIVYRETRGAIPLVANCTTLNSGASLDLAQHAQRHGARAALIMPPYYGDFTEAEFVGHFKTIASYAALPLIVVDQLGRLSKQAVLEIQQFPRVNIAHALSTVWPDGPQTSSTVTTYEWVTGGVLCSPLAGIFGRISPKLDLALLKTWSMTMRDFGPLRVLKCAYPNFDLEMGDCRSPYLPLSPQRINVVRALTMLVKAKEKTAGNPAA